MKIKWRVFIGIVCSIILWGNFVRADGPTENDERILAPLRNAGINLDDKTLIGVLNHTNKFLATRAALVLGSRGENTEIVSALANAASDSDETLAFTAIRSLHALKDNSWCPLALKRLHHIKNRAIQIQLAELLAKTGNVDGWDIIAEAILDSDYSSLALQSVDAFDMKVKGDGKRINVGEELRNIALTAPAETQEKIRRKLAN